MNSHLLFDPPFETSKTNYEVNKLDRNFAEEEKCDAR